MPREFAARGIENPAQRTFKNIDDWYTREYSRVLEPYDFQMRVQDPKKAKGTLVFTQRVQEALNSIPTKAARRKVRQELNQILKGQTNNRGVMSGEAVSAVKTAMRNRRVASKKKPDIADGWRRASEAFDDDVERQLAMQNMPHAVAYRALRAPYRNLVTLEEAAAGVKGKFGELTPDDLYRTSIRKAKREQGPRAVAQGRAPLQMPAQRGAGQVYTIDPTRRQANSIFQLGALAGITGLGGATAPIATGGLWGGLLATVPYRSQQWLMQGAPLQQPLRRLQRNRAFQEALSAGRAGVTTGMTD